MTRVKYLYKLALPCLIIIFTSCANKFFPDKTLYQYPKKTNDAAVVYPDGSIHHSDGSVTWNEGKKIQTETEESANVNGDKVPENLSADNSAAPKKEESIKDASINTSSRKDATGRHARY